MSKSYCAPTGYWLLRLGSRTLLFNQRAWLVALIMLLLLAAVALTALSLGSGKMTAGQALQTLLGQGNRLQELMLFRIRLPRVLAVIVAGAALGLSGCLIQTLVRNRLATPDMIGVNEGATLSIVIFSLYLTLGSWPWWAAPLGAGFAALVLFSLCRRPGEQSYLFIVVGIGLSEMFNAIGDFAMSRQALVHLGSLYLWTMGNFSGQAYANLTPITLLLAALCPLLIWLSRPLALLRFSDATAQNLGIRVPLLQLGILALAIAVAGLGTAIGGPVIFIAMAAPIIASWLTGGSSVPLWVAALGGAVLLLASDTLVRVLAHPHEVPTGIMTRIIGGFLLLFLLFKDRRWAD